MNFNYSTKPNNQTEKGEKEMIFSEQKKEKIVDQINEYVENNPIEIYVDYNWEFSPDDVTSILNNVNNMGDIISDIESNYCQYNDGTEYDEYFKEMIEKIGDQLEIGFEQLESLRDLGLIEYPYFQISQSGVNTIISNTNCHIQAILGDSIDISEGLETFFERIPSEYVDSKLIDETNDGISTLGQITFLLNDLASVIDCLESDSPTVTFKAGTSIFVYNYFEGCGVFDTVLIKDLTVNRNDISLFNDDQDRYGINSCYGLTETPWEGEIRCS
jgi:hypothetical protein